MQIHQTAKKSPEFKRWNAVLLGILMIQSLTCMAGALPRVAVLDFYITENTIHIGKGFDEIYFGAEQGKAFGIAVSTVLSNTGRFTVIERSQLGNVNNERVFSQLTSGIGYGSGGGFGGADYCLLGELTSFDVNRTDTPIPYSDHERTQYSGNLSVNIRLVSLQNGKILSARKIDIREVRDQISSPGGFVDELMNMVAKRSVNEVLSVAYPVKVASVSNDVVYLNKGEDGDFKIGSRFKVYSTGPAIKDPDSKQSIGQEEVEIADIEIMEVLPKSSKAKILSATGGMITSGMICRISSFEPVVDRGPKTRGSSAEPIRW